VAFWAHGLTNVQPKLPSPSKMKGVAFSPMEKGSKLLGGEGD
jgi:hypothetical protein